MFYAQFERTSISSLDIFLVSFVRKLHSIPAMSSFTTTVSLLNVGWTNIECHCDGAAIAISEPFGKFAFAMVEIQFSYVATEEPSNTPADTYEGKNIKTTQNPQYFGSIALVIEENY